MSYAGSMSQQPYLGRSDSNTLYPATVLQLLRAEQPHARSNFFLDGIKLDRVTCVACIVDTHEYNSTKVYFLEDGSAGRLRVSWSLGPETRRLLEESQDFRTQRYVRVMGRLKVFNGVNELNADQIRPILDMHEPFFHCLEAIVAFASNQRIFQSAPPAQPTTPVVSQSPTQRYSAQTNRRAEDTSTTQNLGPDSDTALEEFDGLTLVDYSIDDLHELGFLQEPSFPLQSPSRPQFLSADHPSDADNQPALILDPYSSLSLLQRDIIIQIHDNRPHFPDGVPIATMYRLIDRPTVGELEIRQAIEDLIDLDQIYLTTDHLLLVVD